MALSNSLSCAAKILRHYPERSGATAPNWPPGMRSVAQGNYVIFFRYLGTALEVVTVLEGHRDIVAYFDDGTR